MFVGNSLRSMYGLKYIKYKDSFQRMEKEHKHFIEKNKQNNKEQNFLDQTILKISNDSIRNKGTFLLIKKEEP